MDRKSFACRIAGDLGEVMTQSCHNREKHAEIPGHPGILSPILEVNEVNALKIINKIYAGTEKTLDSTPIKEMLRILREDSHLSGKRLDWLGVACDKLERSSKNAALRRKEKAKTDPISEEDMKAFLHTIPPELIASITEATKAALQTAASNASKKSYANAIVSDIIVKAIGGYGTFQKLVENKVKETVKTASEKNEDLYNLNTKIQIRKEYIETVDNSGGAYRVNPEDAEKEDYKPKEFTIFRGTCNHISHICTFEEEAPLYVIEITVGPNEY